MVCGVSMSRHMPASLMFVVTVQPGEASFDRRDGRDVGLRGALPEA